MVVINRHLEAYVNALQTVQAESPLPGGIAVLFRFFFNQPQWLQVAAVAIGTLLFAALLVLLWRRRAAVGTWFRTRPRPVAVGLLVLIALVIAGSAAAGAWTWNYSQHSNAFCTSCHVMGPAYQRFTLSQHRQLECHDCHRQGVVENMRQLYLWVANRPQEIGPHAKVPNEVCSACHVTGEAEQWQRIASTAGHKVHLESDSSALRGMQCVSCHGVEVHQFAPASKTCGQAGCHPSNVMKLAVMTDTTALHCVACHQFTAELPTLAKQDGARGTLRPGEAQCMACHQMFPAMQNYDVAADPHGGQCANCHNPHRQSTTAEAAQRCTGCHTDWRQKEFHQLPMHAGFASRCTRCHERHVWKADGSDCETCHARAAQRG